VSSTLKVFVIGGRCGGGIAGANGHFNPTMAKNTGQIIRDISVGSWIKLVIYIENIIVPITGLEIAGSEGTTCKQEVFFELSL